MALLTGLLLMAGHSSFARTGTETNTVPGSTTQPAGTQLSISKLVDKTTARIGDVLSYTLVISNVGSTTATNVVARDSSTTGLRYVAGSASVPAGGTFSSGVPISTWTVPSISAGQSLSLTFQAIADSSGILYTRVTIPGDTATVCTSVPVKVCTGDTYLFRLTAAPGRSSYKWFKNGVELTTQTTNVLDVTATGAYSLAIDNVSGRCPDFSCCPFVVEEDTLPTFRATVLPVTCVDGTAQANGRITLTNYNPAYTYQYSAGTDFNPAASRSGSAKVIPASGIIVTNVANPGAAQPYTIRVFNASGCYTDVTVTMQPTACCALSAVVTASSCQPATNTYLSTAVVTLTNPPAGTLVVTNGPQSTTFATTTAPTASFTAVFSNLIPDGASHTITASLPGCSTVTTTYSAPTSCSVTPVPSPSLALSVTPGDCQSATNGYNITGTLSLTNATAGTATITDGSSTTLAIAAGATSIPYSLSGLASGTGSHTVTVSYASQTISQTYTAPLSCSATPTPTLALSIMPGDCQSATNGYTLSGTLSLTNALAGTATLSDGNITTTLSVSAGASSVPYSLSGLSSGTGSHTVTVGYASQTVSQTYTAPASCSVTPAPTLGLSVTPGLCQTATNSYSLTGTLSLTNAVASTATLSDGSNTTSVSVGVGVNSVPYSLSGLISGTGTHTVTVSYASQTVSQTYAAPLSCSVVASPILSLSSMTNECQSATNGYTLTGSLSLTNAIAGTATITDGSNTNTIPVSANETSVPYSLSGLVSGTGSHTVTVTYAGQTVSQIYTAPASCSVTPACSLSATATAGVCTIATNTFSASVVVNLTNVGAGTLTVSLPGSTLFSQAIKADTRSLTILFDSLVSDGASRTATVSLPSCATTTVTFTAPASCSVTPVPTLALSAIPGNCQSMTNSYTISGTLSLTNAVAGTAIITDGNSTTSISVNVGIINVPYSLTGLVSGTGSHTVTVSYAGQISSQTYTAPASCTTAPVCSLSATVTAGLCQSATNTYSSTVVVTIANPTTATLTVTNAGQTQFLKVTSATTSVTAVFADMVSDGGSHTVDVSLPGCTSMTTTYSAPVSCSAATRTDLYVADPGICDPATNTYATTGIISLTNAAAGTAILTDGSSTTLIAISAGVASVPYSLSGLISGTGLHTVTVTYLGQAASTSYTAPASCSVTPRPNLTMSVTPGDCQTATNGYTLSGTLSLTNALAGTATLSDGNITTTLSVSAGASSVPYSLSGLTSGTGSHTVTVSYTSQTLSQTYTAPLSCSVAVSPVCSVSAVVKAISVTCQDNVTQANGQIVLSDFNPSYTYQYSAGAIFDSAASLSGPAKAIPADGMIVNTLTNPAANQPYTVRVYGKGDCYTDVTMVLKPAVCDCTADVCVPFVIEQTKRAKRIGDAR